MNLDDFHLAASIAFRGAWVKTSVEICTGDTAPRYGLTVLPQAPDEAEHADAATPSEALRKVRDKLAKQREDKIEAAKALLASIA